MSDNIPRIIHQYWTGGPVPAEFLDYHRRWIALHPGWKVILWGDGEGVDGWPIPPLRNQDLFDRAEEISPLAPHQLRSDILRYELLLDWGGVWADMDFQPQKAIDRLCFGVDAWACWEEPGTWINNAILAAEPHHRLLRELIDGLSVNVSLFRASHGNTVKSGPQYLTPLALKHGVKVYPRDHFFPYGWRELHLETSSFPDAYAVHRWNHRRGMKHA